MKFTIIVYYLIVISILPLVFESVDPYIFADPDLGNQNVADPTDHSVKV